MGFLLARADNSLQFRDWALRRARELFTELLDADLPWQWGVLRQLLLWEAGLAVPLVPPIVTPGVGGRDRTEEESKSPIATVRSSPREGKKER